MPSYDPAMLHKRYPTRRFGLAVIVLLTVTILMAVFFGLQTERLFRSIQTSWISYVENTEKKGIWISQIRAHLGYGGMIHNFKNYVLRQDPAYLQQFEEQWDSLDNILRDYANSDAAVSELSAIWKIKLTADLYAKKIPTAKQAAEEGWPPTRTDKLVKVDDLSALKALHELERVWLERRQLSTSEIFIAVNDGERLITVGFVFLLGLAVVAMALYGFLYLMIRQSREMLGELSGELVERRRAVRAERKLARAVEQSPVSILITDTSGNIEYVNAKFEQLTGYAQDEVRGTNPRFLRSSLSDKVNFSEIWHHLTQGEEWQGILQNRKKNGEHYWADMRLLPLKDEQQRIINYIGFGEDITEQKKTEEKMVRTQKMEALGQLAGGVAHDFNNILTAILGNVHLAQMELPENAEGHQELNHIEIAAKRAQSLVKQILAFARRQPATPKPMVIAEIVDEVLRLIRASVPANIEILLGEIDRQAIVLADATHIHQVLMNLCRNAVEAIGADPGCLTVSVRRISSTGKPGDGPDRLSLVVHDTGAGIPKEVQDKIFDPFFTTKPVGKSTGLGLSVVRSIIEESEGSIAVHSEPGNGTSINISLPLYAGDQQTSGDAAVPVGGHERLLLVDDEEEVLKVLQRILSKLGYHVEACDTPNTALSLFKSRPGDFDLVITDLIMPAMNGGELAKEIHEIRPDCPLILCSAYTPDNIEIDLHHFRKILEKPTNPAVFSRSIRAVLEESPPEMAVNS